MSMKGLVLFLLCLSFAACSSKQLAFEHPEKVEKNAEFEKIVKIVGPDEKKEAKEEPAAPVTTVSATAKTAPVKPAKKPARAPKPKKKTKKELAAEAKAAVPAGPQKHEPADVEDQAGFDGRRPVKDPFRVGETVVHDVNYNLLNISAGTLTMKVDPFVEVNGRKSYSFVTELQTYPAFSRFVYSVADKATALMDFELLIPRVFTLHVKESSQIKEAKSFFDYDTLKAHYWENKVTQKDGAEEKKLDWDILPFSQNMFSAIYYMRVFQWETGKEYAFRVSDDRENLIFRGTAVRREVLDTEIGKRPCVVVKAEIMTKGIFKPVGDIFIWLSDDDRKLVLRIESKIKIGTLVSEVIRIDPGKE